MQVCQNFLLKKMWAKAAHIFSAKNIRILYIESAKTVHEMTLNKLIKLTKLWTTRPWILFIWSYRKIDHCNKILLEIQMIW